MLNLSIHTESIEITCLLRESERRPTSASKELVSGIAGFFGTPNGDALNLTPVWPLPFPVLDRQHDAAQPSKAHRWRYRRPATSCIPIVAAARTVDKANSVAAEAARQRWQ
jgi:hypothetical protein